MDWARLTWSYIAYRKDLFAALLGCAFVMALAELSVPWLIKEAIDAVLDETADIDLDLWLLLTAGVLAVLYVGHAALLRVEAYMILHCSYNLRRRLYTHIHSQALPFFQRHRTGELMHRVTSDAKMMENETSNILRDMPGEIVTVIGVTILMVLLDPGMAMLIVGFMLIAAAVTGWLGVPLPSLRRSAQRIAARLTSRFQEGVAGVRTVQAFKNEAYELDRLDAENRRILEVELKEGKVYALMEPLGDLMELLGLVLVVWYGGHLILEDQITAGTLVAFIAYMEILARPLGNAEGYYRSLQSIRAVGGRLQELLDDQERLASGDRRPQADGDWPVVAESVSFRHPDSDRDILSDVSFTVKAGEAVAIAGRNGAGKSTLLDLILRFHDPSSGRLLVDGVDLREWDLEAYRGAVGVMGQDVFLFHGTILDNIAYARPDAGADEIAEAVRQSGLDRLMQRFPKRLDTVVGERGAQLSGGERQSVALARLFLRRPRLLILDEPTSQLDGEALGHVCTALASLMAGRTSFIVTHNAETIRLASRVLFLEQGRLAAEGRHDALYAGNARYKALWDEKGNGRRAAAGKRVRTPAE